MSYARARLWLGICGVGTIVLSSVLSLVLHLPSKLLPDQTAFSVQDVITLIAVILVYAAVQAPFDFFGGHILPTEYGRSRQPFGAFLSEWLRGVLAHGILYLVIGLTLLAATRVGGFAAMIGAFMGVNLFLLIFQTVIARIVSPIIVRTNGNTSDTLPVQVAQNAPEFFTGGIVGIPGFERLILPSQWEAFPDEQRNVILLRKTGTIKTGSRNRGLLLALTFNAIGFALASALAGGTASVAGLVTTSLWFTLWSFLGLLILPIPSQNGVFCADAFAIGKGASVYDLSELVRRLDRDQDDEPSRPNGIERIFHPLPSVSRRLARLTEPEPATPDAWHAARTAIYLSWAGMSLLSRAVHCNSGRPSVWVFLPSD